MASAIRIGAWLRQGRVWISALALVTFVVGWFAYDQMMAPQWSRDFGLDMAARAKVVAEKSGGTAFSTMKGRPDPDSPFICMSNSATFTWDRVFIVASGGELLSALESFNWGDTDIAGLRQRMRDDARYQLIVFEADGHIVEYGYYFTLWADLTSLSLPTGLERQKAVFLAESDGQVYTLTVAETFPDTACD